MYSNSSYLEFYEQMNPKGLTGAMLGSVHFQILCSNDGCNWHVALASNREDRGDRQSFVKLHGC